MRYNEYSVSENILIYIKYSSARQEFFKPGLYVKEPTCQSTKSSRHTIGNMEKIS